MSDYSIYEVSSWTSDTHSNAGITSQTATQFEITSQDTFGSYDDTLVKVGVNVDGVTRYVYGVHIDQVPQQVGAIVTIAFDGNVYGDLLSGSTFVSYEYYNPNANHVVLELNNYNLSPSLTLATYGKDYKPYHSTLSYNIQAPQQRVVYDSKFRKLYNLNDNILLDSCNNRVYSVVPSDLSAVAVNGRIKTALTFNVFIK